VPSQTTAAKKTKISLDGTKQEEPGDNDEEELVPLQVAKSLSLPIARQPHTGARSSSASATATETSIQLIKSLMALLLEQDAPRSADVQVQDKADEVSAANAHSTLSQYCQHVPQVWSLVLKSFTTVSVSKLVEARIVDALIKAFLRTTEEIQ
jgi:hypothetical protein